MLRYDVTTNDWVIFAPSRAMRPENFRRRPYGRGDNDESPCPFCPGNESMTPREIATVRDESGWQVRVVPNKFPALRIEENHRRVHNGGLFRSMGGCGAHEVIIDSPQHKTPLALQPVEQITRILHMMHDRYNDLMRDARFQSIVIFKNHGQGAGTSLVHPHSQLIATPVTPHAIRQRLAIAAQHFDETGECLYCSLLEEEIQDGRRVLAENGHFAAVLPFASHVPFEIWLLPKHRQSSFHWVDPSLFRPLAELLKVVLAKLYVGLRDPDFNLTVNTGPRGQEDSEFFLWHIQILPRLTTPAGFELGSGMSINTVLPEDAADFLRGIDITNVAPIAETIEAAASTS
jgi:UDPglucose--hexose-1-phosphate uridylyltransferase